MLNLSCKPWCGFLSSSSPLAAIQHMTDMSYLGIGVGKLGIVLAIVAEPLV